MQGINPYMVQGYIREINLKFGELVSGSDFQNLSMIYHSLWNNVLRFMKLNFFWSCEYGYQIIKLFTTWNKIGWKFDLNWLSTYWTWFTIPMILVRPISKLVCKIMKLSLHLCEFILPKVLYAIYKSFKECKDI